MGDDRVYAYVKSVVDEWDAQDRDVVTVNEVLNNVSVMRCAVCTGTGSVGGTGCPTCAGDGLKTFLFVGAVVDVQESMQARVRGEFAGDYYQALWNADNAARVAAGGTAVRMDHGKPFEDKRFALTFDLDDGENSVRCCIHNFRYLYPNGFDDNVLPEMVSRVREAFQTGGKIQVKGKPFPFRESRYREVPFIFVSEVELDSSDFESKLTDEQMSTFLLKCQESTDYIPDELERVTTDGDGQDRRLVSPLDIAKTELWKKVHYPDYLKEALTLYCLSPKRHQEQLLVALITAPGEGKDYMLNNVLRPVVRVGVAGSGLTTRPAALIGAMESSNLSRLSHGLFARFHHARAAVSEFNTWESEAWSALLEVMGSGEITISKGNIAGRKIPATLNLLLLGNPPVNYEEGINSKLDTLACFRDYTYQMISRCTLIFVEMSLTKDENSVRARMVDNIDGDTANIRDVRLEYFRKFFHEYFKKVSGMNALLKPVVSRVNFVFDAIAENERYVKLLAPRGRKDKRKYQQFLNLAKFEAKLNARGFQVGNDMLEITDSDIKRAARLFERSAASLADNFDLSLLNISPVEHGILHYIIQHPGETLIAIRKGLRLMGAEDDAMVHTSIRLLESLGKIKEMDGRYYPEIDGVHVPLKESRHQETPVSEVLAKVQTMVSIITKRIVMKDEMAADLAYHYIQGNDASDEVFAQRIYKAMHGQVDEKTASAVWKVLKESAL